MNHVILPHVLPKPFCEREGEQIESALAREDPVRHVFLDERYAHGRRSVPRTIVVGSSDVDIHSLFRLTYRQCSNDEARATARRPYRRNYMEHLQRRHGELAADRLDDHHGANMLQNPICQPVGCSAFQADLCGTSRNRVKLGFQAHDRNSDIR